MAGETFASRIDANAKLLQMAGRVKKRPIVPEPANLNVLSGEQKAAYEQALSDMANSFEKVRKEIKRRKGHGKKEKRRNFSAKITIADPTAAAAFNRFFMEAVHHARMPSTAQLLRRSVLVLLVSDFESLIADVARVVLRERPGVGSIDAATITLAEMQSLETVAAARKVLIDRKVEDLMRQSLDDWTNWYAKIGVKWTDLTEDWTAFAEVFLRRNVHVHADGRVSHQYLDSLQAAGAKAADLPTLGDLLDLSDDYLNGILDRLLAFGILLVGGTMLQLRPDETSVAERWLVAQVTRTVETGRPLVTQHVAATILRTSRDRWSRTTISGIQVAMWVAMLELEMRKEVESQVRRWDVDGLDLKIAHAKAVLLGDYDRAVLQVKDLLERGHLTVIDLVGQRLYRELMENRKDELLPHLQDVPQPLIPEGAALSEVVQEVSSEEESQ